MVKTATADRLTVIVYSGTTGLEDYKAVASWYEALGCQKPQHLMGLCVDRHESVYDLNLAPQFKLFLTAPNASFGGQLTPSGTRAVLRYNQRKLYEWKNMILEQARRVRAKEIKVVFLHTLVGGTGFTVALRFALLLKSELEGIMPLTTIFFSTVPPLDVSQRPAGMQDGLKLANTDFALRQTVAVSPKIDLMYIRFPYELNVADRRIGYLLRALGLLPVEGIVQGNPFQSEQLIAIASEKQYPLVLSVTLLLRFPKDQLKQRELLVAGLDEFSKEYSKLKNELNELREKNTLPPSPSEKETHDLMEKIGHMAGVRSKRWRTFLAEAQEKVESARQIVDKAVREAGEAAVDLERSEETLKTAETLIKRLESLLAWLDQELANGHYKEGLYVLRVSKEEREKLGPYSAFEKMPLRTVMEKLGREKELYDLVQGQIDQSIEALLQQLIGIKFPKNAVILDEIKVVASSSTNISHITTPQGVQLVEDPVFQDEVVIVAMCMVEFEPTDALKTFDWVRQNREAIDKFQVPLSKRPSICLTDEKSKPPEQFISEVKLCGQGKNTQGKTLMEVDEV